MPKPSRWVRFRTSVHKLAVRALLGAAVVAGHAWRGVVRHGIAVAAVLLLSIGAGMVFPPAGLITAGLLLLGDRVVDDWREDRDRRASKGGEPR
ncbi:hypothetical protein [Saccharothrix texasensis]|uniref:Uncharacterized protein n=1 Tax=Saccharothrix texasensis TaxID=103734 RepID=A0A3N1H1C5_9PSEU|nr:hypothetical protein [Saccharothrix texasensis]ROP36278.1 hypothetical protein EDD40_1543 [Saccharothrix texasensis]